MNKRNLILCLVLALSLVATGCTSEKDIGAMLKKNPALITDAIKANPGEFMLALQEAAKAGQAELAKKRR